MTRLSITRLHHGLLATLAIAALVLLATFYSVVAAAVDQAATKRAQAPTMQRVESAARADRTAPGRRPMLVAVVSP